ncbi:MAG: hypothetical protein ACHQRM_09425 [Bacteroidia bacterium]
METYVVLISMSGILALVSGVALLTFHDDLRKYFRFRILKFRRSRRNRPSASPSLAGIGSHFNEKGDSFYLENEVSAGGSVHMLKEGNGVI